MASSKTVQVSEDPERTSSALAKTIGDFAVRIHRILSVEGENVFFSPFSLSVAMSMLLRGSKEESTEEISKVLGFNAVNMSTDEIHRSFGDLMTAISESEESYILAVANALACKRTFKLIPEYRNDLENLYRAATWEMDFSMGTEKAIAEINEWVKSNTRGMIPNLLDSLDQSIVLILLNAVYFKGSWEYPFDPKRTCSKNFYNRGLDSMLSLVDMMTIKKYFPYMETEIYQALELPYKGNHISMLILLPNERNGLMELEKMLEGDFLPSVRSNLSSAEVKVTLPKFRLEYSKGLKTAFTSLGVSTIFENRRANFKGLSNEPGLAVSEILHKAVIDVNELGSEAAAVTALMVAGCCFPPPPEIRFTVDHPFLFVIYDKRNDMIFFMGSVMEL